MLNQIIGGLMLAIGIVICIEGSIYEHSPFSIKGIIFLLLFFVGAALLIS